MVHNRSSVPDGTFVLHSDGSLAHSVLLGRYAPTEEWLAELVAMIQAHPEPRLELTVDGGRVTMMSLGQGEDAHILIVSRPINGQALRSLTPRQRHVAELLARGSTAREVATLLNISPHTVRQHLKTVYRVLGISSRSELVRVLAVPTDELVAPEEPSGTRRISRGASETSGAHVAETTATHPVQESPTSQTA